LLKKKKRTPQDIRILMRMTEDMEYFQKVNLKRINIENELHKKICLNMQFDFRQKG
jgi:hypothetical protein